jgi:hypothetical protein
MKASFVLILCALAGVEGRKKARHRRNYDEDDSNKVTMVEVDTFCGFENCYKVLDLKRGVNSAAVKRSYRKLSRPVHADKDSSAKAKKAFLRYSNAKEVLTNPAKQALYHDFLDHPSKFRFGSSMDLVAPKTNPLFVIVGLWLFISMIQYMYQIQKHNVSVERHVKSRPIQNALMKEINTELGAKLAKSKSSKTSKAKKSTKTRRAELLEAAEAKMRADLGTGRSKAQLSKTMLMFMVGYLWSSSATVDDSASSEDKTKQG